LKEYHGKNNFQTTKHKPSQMRTSVWVPSMKGCGRISPYNGSFLWAVNVLNYTYFSLELHQMGGTSMTQQFPSLEGFLSRSFGKIFRLLCAKF